MTAKTIAKAIYFGQIGVADTSGLRNPVVKLLVLLVPMSAVVIQQVARAFSLPRLTMRELVIVGALSYIVGVANFSPRSLSATFRRVLASLIVAGGLYYIVANPGCQLAAIVGIFSKTVSAMPVLRNISGESWLLLFYVLIIVLAIRNFTTRDALWLGRKMLWKWLFEVYALTIVTFATINSSLPLRLRLSMSLARDKRALLRNPYQEERAGRVKRFARWAWVFASTLILHNIEMAHAIESLTYQRGLFRLRYRDQLGATFGAEDAVAVILMCLGVFLIVLHRM